MEPPLLLMSFVTTSALVVTNILLVNTIFLEERLYLKANSYNLLRVFVWIVLASIPIGEAKIANNAI